MDAKQGKYLLGSVVIVIPYYIYSTERLIIRSAMKTTN